MLRCSFAPRPQRTRVRFRGVASPSTKIPAFFLRIQHSYVGYGELCIQFAESHDWLFLSLDTILSNRIKKLSIAFVVHNRCFIKISLDGHLA